MNWFLLINSNPTQNPLQSSVLPLHRVFRKLDVKNMTDIIVIAFAI